MILSKIEELIELARKYMLEGIPVMEAIKKAEKKLSDKLNSELNQSEEA